jgi:nucleoside-diphosphate-sugar epimerase
MQSVIVAGGAGFIGAHLCESLLKDGYRVICVDNFLTSDRENISNLLENPNFSLIEKDVIKISSDDLPSSDFIFHLASPASPNVKSERSYMAFPIETLLVNSQGTHNLLEVARRNNSRFLYASTSEIYGDPAVSPQSEDYFGNVNPIGVRSVYDEGKRFGEAITSAYVRKFGLNAIIVRIFNTYGPGMRKDDGRVISNFINQALSGVPVTIYGQGDQTRSFCYISDMVEGLKGAIFTQEVKGEVVNLGNPEEKTVKETADYIIKLTSSSSQIEYEELPEDDPRERKPDIEKAKKLINWYPKVSLEEGLIKTIQYFKSI